MEVDIIGVENMAEFIKQSGLSKFSIDRVGSSRGTISIYEVMNTKNNSQAIEKFREWSRVVNPNVAYKITLFDKVDQITDENGEEKLVKSKQKSNKSEVYFKLKENEPQFAPAQINGFNRDTVYKEALDQFRTEQRIKDLEDRILEMTNQANEEEEEEEETNIAGINGLNIGNIVSAIQALSLLKGNQTEQNPNAINGINPDQIGNIKKAIGILSKYDDQIDQDLLKLADLAENNTNTFNMLLTTLRKM